MTTTIESPVGSSPRPAPPAPGGDSSREPASACQPGSAGPAPAPRRGLGGGLPVPARRLARGRPGLGGRDPDRDRRQPPRTDRRPPDLGDRPSRPPCLRHRRRGLLGRAVHPDRHRDADPADRPRGRPERRDADLHGPARRGLARSAALDPARHRSRRRRRRRRAARRLVAVARWTRHARRDRRRTGRRGQLCLRRHVRPAPVPDDRRRRARHGPARCRRARAAAGRRSRPALPARPRPARSSR